MKYLIYVVMSSLTSFVTWACSFINPPEFCKKAVPTFSPVLHAVFDLFNSTIMCSRFSLCSDPAIVLDKDSDYISRVLRSVPPRYSPKVANTSGTLRMLVFTDAHVDMDYQEVK